MYIGFIIPTLAALLLQAGFFGEFSSDYSSSNSSSLSFAPGSVLSVADSPSFLFFFLFFFFSFALLALFDGGFFLSVLYLLNSFL